MKKPNLSFSFIMWAICNIAMLFFANAGSLHYTIAWGVCTIIWAFNFAFDVLAWEKYNSLRIVKIEHQGFVEFRDAMKSTSVQDFIKKSGFHLDQYFGRWQYIFIKRNHKISLVELKDPFREVWFWEALSLNGDLIEQRFPTKEMAIKRIKEILDVA